MKVFPKLWASGTWETVVYGVADKGYDFCVVAKLVRDSGRIPVIPRRKGALCPGVQDKQRYKTRSAIERFFGNYFVNSAIFDVIVWKFWPLSDYGSSWPRR